jgi:hypothetical protein
MFLAVSSMPGTVSLHELLVILPSRFDDAFPRDTPRAESRYECAVLAAQHDDVRVRLVKVVLERGEQQLFCAHFARHQPLRNASKANTIANRRKDDGRLYVSIHRLLMGACA